ncbi:MAG: Fe/S biogenesis protein NfuA [Gemmatimonadetes bacterium]|mgnify:CR=1 FL=1|nr:Fe/S biogenesis protein NfuA [Gemmatimonadota bacterium]
MTKRIKDPISFSQLAQDTILNFIGMQGEPAAVRISVASDSPLDPRYEVTLIDLDERGAEDFIFDGNGFEVLIDPKSLELLEGTRIDWVETLTESGFKFDNPNLKPIGTTPIEGELAEKVQQVIDEYIRPGVAQHGGNVALVEVRDDVVYVQMGGGCQGCGLASVTLNQGVERILKEKIPEIKAVVDITNHAAGSNPYTTNSAG